MKKAILLNSGGLDSLVTAKTLYDQEWELHSLYIDFGQLNGENAKKSAENTANKYCKSHKVLKIGDTSFAVQTTTRNGRTFFGVPFQASVTHILGASYSRSLEIDYVASGVKSDATDNNFFDALFNLLNTTKLCEQVIFMSPIYRIIPIKDVFNKGLEIGLTVEEMKNTVSCNQENPCGNCGKCRQRKEVGLLDE